MKVLIVVLIVVIVLLAALLIASVLTNRGGAIRRGELKRAKAAQQATLANLKTLESTVDEIESALDTFSDLESPLAATVRQHIREYRRGRIDHTV